MKILIVDDDKDIVQLLEIYVRNETAQKYGQYYQQHDAWNHETDNLTHRPGIAHAK